ncbi:phosphatase 2C-like domain-containing protein [Halteromyces radiatus]|uniref:phosphatase 2C-like domain-containing protein n=1 Tax=Halteromyces radiatus TaxID=101107 RepID=UPI00221EE08D|nr:phosphatase 2C-like domain-containing protein [Halteromyces radiatus]KAI8084842.1 phosphatase 2C-like domain-containing protein [Halteromyces radiatus]
MNVRSRLVLVSTPLRQVHSVELLQHIRSFAHSSSPSAEIAPSPSFDYSSLSPKTLPLYDFFANVKPKPSYRFTSGASGYAKRRVQQPTTTEAYCGHQVGEDAYFLRHDSLSVADGVGGWINTKGAQSSLYSRKLMHHAYLELERYDNIEDPLFCEYEKANPLTILQKSYDETKEEAINEGVIGSSTACLALLRDDELRVANLGDCGISIIRHNSYVFRSEEQQHAFNFPYQLGTQSRDQPHHANVFNVKVERGDIIIMASDGLFDNVFDRDILRMINEYNNHYGNNIPSSPLRRFANIQPQGIADMLASHAKHISESRQPVDTPFQRRAMSEGIPFHGGKSDDISVLVAIVNDCEDSPDRRL